METIIVIGLLIKYWPIALAVFVLSVIISIVSSIDKKQVTKNHSSYADIDHNQTHTYYSAPSRSSDDTRLLYGMPVRSEDDYKRWSVLRGFAGGLERHVRELENACTDKEVLNAEQKYHEWEQAYEKYRNFCRSKQFWNAFVGDRKIFVPTGYQESQERVYKKSVKKRYEDSVYERELYIDLRYHIEMKQRLIMDYINSSPGKRANRRTMLSELSGKGDRSLVQKAYKELLKNKVIGEKQDGSNCLVRIIHHRKKNNPNDMPASVYKPGLYSHVDRRTIYKVDYTVATPKNIDREKNTCQFVSMTSGETYFTSLEKCTCPVYDPKQPCKHMVALAMYLGYYNRNDAQD